MQMSIVSAIYYHLPSTIYHHLLFPGLPDPLIGLFPPDTREKLRLQVRDYRRGTSEIGLP
jgi:hypothetical protein